MQLSQIVDLVQMSQIADLVQMSQIADLVQMSQIADLVQMSQIADLVQMSQIADLVQMSQIAFLFIEGSVPDGEGVRGEAAVPLRVIHDVRAEHDVTRDLGVGRRHLRL